MKMKTTPVMRSNKSALAVIAAGLCLAACVRASSGESRPSSATNPPNTTPAAAKAPKTETLVPNDTVEVLLCDGKTKINAPAGTPGVSIAGSLMAEWIRKHPGSNWENEERERHTLLGAADNQALVGQVDGQTYGQITSHDVALWKAETERAALAGSMVFHDAEQLGSTIGVSCDMCHPHAANTHPETYPKFQAQLGRVALLRDMINWCIEHPIRGKALASEDPRMRALEAYILAQRKGRALEYGKH
jgi:thiosulfate dehydrogenase